MAEDTNLKFCKRTESKGLLDLKIKIRSKGRGPGHVTYFSHFGTPIISLKRLKVQTSNFACGLYVRNTKPKK